MHSRRAPYQQVSLQSCMPCHFAHAGSGGMERADFFEERIGHLTAKGN